MNADEFRKFGHNLIDWIADYRSRVEEFPVQAQTKAGEVRARFSSVPPEEPEDFAAVFREFETWILPGLTHWLHPRFFGYFPSNSNLSSVLGDCLSTGLGVLGLSWQASPALTELEEVAVDWVRQMVGLSDGWSGVIQDTASTTTLIALLCARERTSAYSAKHGGLQSVAKPLVVYTSAQSHSSVEKGVLLAGFGKENLRQVEVDRSFALRPEALEAAIQEDLAEGRAPCAIVATTGTTTTTAMDPIAKVAELAHRHGLWLHVDAAMAGSAMILPECRWMWDGIEAADSVVINAHKWLGASFDCSLYFVREPDALVRVMSTNPSYLQSAADGEVKNLRDWGIPLGRRFRALKLWSLLRTEGAARLRDRIRRDLSNAKWLEQEVTNTVAWRVLAPVALQTVCVRHEPPGLTGADLDLHTLEWVRRVNDSGLAYLTPALLMDRWMARVAIGAELTERRHVEDTWRLMQQEATRSVSS
jgi:aromatic-L-amino-acid decarboxylase